jgi:hypothetical protein
VVEGYDLVVSDHCRVVSDHGLWAAGGVQQRENRFLQGTAGRGRVDGHVLPGDRCDARQRKRRT